MQSNYAGQVEIIGVAGRDDIVSIQEFVTNFEVDGFTHAVDEELAIWREYGIRSQPAFAFLSADGGVETHSGPLGVDELSNRIDALLAS
ncbi:MAG: hypothetical protein HKN24_04485 [Acidimicrobiales bacterium]|nr:hypothetical protein [Acidimicrobiales bacterium]